MLSFLSGCATVDPTSEAVNLDKTLTIQENQLITIKVNTGRVTIHGSNNNQLEIQGKISFPDKTTVQINESPEQITLSVEYRKSPFFSASTPPVELDIIVPNEAFLQFEGFDTEINIADFSGTAVISVTAGNIQADHLTGTISLQSGRGDIHLADSRGDIRVLGEHGTLTVVESNGGIIISTIMGTIVFMGDVLAEDKVHLEVDHGPVEVQLRPTSDVALAAASTSGDVACRLPQRTFTTWGCTAELGSANGRLDIRTVSGRINIQLIP